MPRTLIFGTSYIGDQQAKWLLEQWVAVTRKLNPEADILLVDTAGPAFPKDIQGDEIFRFPDNPGHLWKTGKDGWGRAFTKGLELALLREYDYAVFIEGDLLFVRPVAPIIERMAVCGIGAAAPVAHPYAMMETGLMFMDLAYMREIKFIERYDWPNSPKLPLTEVRVEGILGDKFWALPLYGVRDDGKSLTAKNMVEAFPRGLAWLHHSTPAMFRAMMAANGLQEA